MPAILTVPPAVEPIALADLKAHLSLDGGEHDATLTRLIATARQHVETTTRRALIAQGWRVTLDRWPYRRRVVLPVAPVRAILSVTVFDALGEPIVLAPALYALDRVRVPAVLVAAPGVRVPGLPASGIAIDLEAGHGPAAADVPAPLREAVLRLAARWFEHRLDPDAAASPPPIVEALIAPYRVRL
jgi:uncharacterized phiE125 gp8 family phage protein